MFWSNVIIYMGHKPTLRVNFVCVYIPMLLSDTNIFITKYSKGMIYFYFN